MINSPFKFLDSYTKDDASIFFGREKETEELYRKIFENKTLLVYGVSGTGKTSIINCGLANKFNEADWLPVTIRRNQNMVESFYGALHKLSPDTKDKAKRDVKAFIKLLQSVYLDHFKPVYLLFDQFEELFIFGDEEEQEAFVDIIAQIKASEVQVKILFIMREEYLANMSAFEEKIPDLLTNRLRIEKMSTAKVKEAITGPCNFAEIGIENEAVETIIGKLTRQGKTIELTYLQVLLDRLFHKATHNQNGDNLQFTQSLVASLGEVSDILGDFLEEQIRQFDNPDAVLDVLKSFVSIRGTKRQSTVEEIGNHLRSLNKAQETGTLQSTIQQLVNLRILREKDENNRYELRHDALAMKIYEKVTLVEKELIEVRDFLENALNNFQKRGRLLSVEDLKYIAPYEEKMFMGADVARLIDISKKEVTKTKRKKRRLLILGLSTLIVVFAIFSIWALNEKAKADIAIEKQKQSVIQLNKSLKNTIDLQNIKLKTLYNDIESSYKATPYRVKHIWNNTQRIISTSETVINQINNAKTLIVSEAENVSIDSSQFFDMAKMNMIDNQKSVKKVLLSDDQKLLNIARAISNLKDSVFTSIDKKDWEKISYNLPPLNEAEWENTYSNIMAGVAITKLNGLIAEIVNVEIQTLEYFQSFTGVGGEMVFDRISTTLMPKSDYVFVGGNYSADFLLSAYNSKANIEAYIFEDNVKFKTPNSLKQHKTSSLISNEGVFSYTKKVQDVGRHLFSGVIEVKRLTDTLYFPFSHEYNVAIPTAIINSLSQNNLYYGINNHIDAFVPGLKQSDISISIAPGRVVSEQGEYYVQPSKVGDCQINIYGIIEGERKALGSKEFKVLNIPDLQIKTNFKNDQVTLDELSAIKRLEINTSELPLPLNAEIKQYSVIVVKSGKATAFSEQGNNITNEIEQEFAGLTRGDLVIFESIKAEIKDSYLNREVEINPLVLKVSN